MNSQTVVNQTHIYGQANPYFSNGYLNCYILEGDIISKSGFQNTLKVDGIEKEISVVGSDQIVVTSDRRVYFLNHETNVIENIMKNH